MDFQEFLKNNKLSCTKSRMQLLEVLFYADFALSEKEIEKKIAKGINKSTIYRNLDLLTEKGLVQRILLNNCIKYKLILRGSNSHETDHIHFHCLRCKKVICMENLKVKDYKLPEGYNKTENQFLIVGICKECNEK